jgi:hypothetical protein
MNSKFWIVVSTKKHWNGTINSFVKHYTEASAKGEAERLARLNHGHEFMVLECIGFVISNDVVWK